MITLYHVSGRYLPFVRFVDDSTNDDGRPGLHRSSPARLAVRCMVKEYALPKTEAIISCHKVPPTC